MAVVVYFLPDKCKYRLQENLALLVLFVPLLGDTAEASLNTRALASTLVPAVPSKQPAKIRIWQMWQMWQR